MVRFLWLLLLCISLPAMTATWNITYPRPLTEFDQRSQYPIQLLTLALEQTGVNYSLRPSDRIMLQSRALKQLRENREVDVVWSMTDQAREEQLLPIRIPIFKGLIGWRVMLVKTSNLEQFSGLQHLTGLRSLKPIQGSDWPDTKILQSNGFEVITSRDYRSMFTLLEQEQGDFFPRSVVEVWSELDSDDIAADIAVEPRIGVRYPTAMYFFVNRRNSTLARLIENGLEKAIANGKFDDLFLQIHDTLLSRAAMQERVFFELDNPLLPAKTPLERQELWYQQGALDTPDN